MEIKLENQDANIKEKYQKPEVITYSEQDILDQYEVAGACGMYFHSKFA